MTCFRAKSAPAPRYNVDPVGAVSVERHRQTRTGRDRPRSAKTREDILDRRNFVVGSAAAAAALAVRPVGAQDTYPSRPITIINPFPPGGASDVVTRPLAAVLETLVKQPCVIETKAGAAGAVGAQFAATAKPDGYTLLSHITSIQLRRSRPAVQPPAKFTNADFIRWRLRRRSVRADRQRPAALQDAEGLHRRRQKRRTTSSSVPQACMAPCISRPPCS